MFELVEIVKDCNAMSIDIDDDGDDDGDDDDDDEDEDEDKGQDDDDFDVDEGWPGWTPGYSSRQCASLPRAAKGRTWGWWKAAGKDCKVFEALLWSTLANPDGVFWNNL